jgi:hypothetical protein
VEVQYLTIILSRVFDDHLHKLFVILPKIKISIAVARELRSIQDVIHCQPTAVAGELTKCISQVLEELTSTQWDRTSTQMLEEEVVDRLLRNQSFLTDTLSIDNSTINERACACTMPAAIKTNIITIELR